MVPSSISPSHNGTGDQTTGIKASSGTQTISIPFSEQAIGAIGYQSNNETTVKILNASLRESTKTRQSIYIRYWKSFAVTTRDMV